MHCGEVFHSVQDREPMQLAKYHARRGGLPGVRRINRPTSRRSSTVSPVSCDKLGSGSIGSIAAGLAAHLGNVG